MCVRGCLWYDRKYEICTTTVVVLLEFSFSFCESRQLPGVYWFAFVFSSVLCLVFLIAGSDIERDEHREPRQPRRLAGAELSGRPAALPRQATTTTPVR